MVGEFRQAQRLGMSDQLAQDAVALGIGADTRDLLRVDAHGVEGRQPLAVRADHPERRVLRVDQGRRGLDDAAQCLLQVEFAADRQHGLQEAVDPVPGATRRVQTGLQLLQQLVEPQLGQPHPGLAGLLGVLHRCSSNASPLAGSRTVHLPR